MTWELAMALIGVVISHIGVEVYRHWRERGREPREQEAIEATAGLTVAQAKLAAEDAENKKLDRTERLYKMVDELRDRMQAQDERIETLSDELDAERDARQASEKKLKAKLSNTISKLKVSVTFAEYLLSIMDPPLPDFPPGWAEIHNFEDVD